MTLKEFLDTHTLCHGVGELDAEGNGQCCSITAMNYVRFGECDGTIRPEDSNVIGCWIRVIQDVMPENRINRERWKSALLGVPGLGRDREKEQERLNILLEWMWGTVLPQLQPVADRHGFGVEWRHMTTHRTVDAARAAAVAALPTAWAADAAAWFAARAAGDAAWVAEAAAWSAERSAERSAEAAERAARSADRAARSAADATDDTHWDAVCPESVLERLVVC